MKITARYGQHDHALQSIRRQWYNRLQRCSANAFCGLADESRRSWSAPRVAFSGNPSSAALEVVALDNPTQSPLWSLPCSCRTTSPPERNHIHEETRGTRTHASTRAVRKPEAYYLFR
ncbi:hypothetical protein BV20DRAFT_372565 [Pilatotrama ljubarskyi]|nr:hypothetical protein BV20DRAFT_372565 [Pilatotrama ljubarskyi]